MNLAPRFLGFNILCAFYPSKTEKQKVRNYRFFTAKHPEHLRNFANFKGAKVRIWGKGIFWG